MADAIKPLVWERCARDHEAWKVKTPFGWIQVFRDEAPASPTWSWSSFMDTTFGYRTADAAKEAAAAWWEMTVTKCLTQHEGN